jgi:hypothetical protein
MDSEMHNTLLEIGMRSENYEGLVLPGFNVIKIRI